MSNFLNKIFNKKLSPEGLTAVLDNYNLNRSKEDKKSFCQAPFKSLYFGHDGKVNPCCYNRRYVLGDISEQSIENIWKDKKIQLLRKALKKNNLNLGCYICEQRYKSKNYSSVSALQYDGLPPENQWPLILEFETDNTCNLECVMCTGDYSSAIRKNKECKIPLENKYGDNFIAQLQPYLKNLKDAKFNGGEPFLSPLYQKIWTDIIRLNSSCRISVQTNGTILNDRVKDFLNRGNFHISVSLDALDKNLYEKIRVNATYEKVIENVLFFRDYCHKKGNYFGIAVCPMRLNWKEMPFLITFANKNKAKIHFHTVWYPPSLALWNMSYRELKDIYKSLERFNWTAHSEIEKDNLQSYHLFIAQIEHWCHNAKQCESEFSDITDMINICAKLIEKINNWCDKNISNVKESQVKKEIFKTLIEEIIEKLGEEEKTRCLREVLKTPVEFIILTLELEDKDKILERFKSFIF